MKKILTILMVLVLAVQLKAGNEKIVVCETSVKIGTMATEELYYGFSEGDQVIINLELVKGRDLKEIEVLEYPSTSISMTHKTKGFTNKTIEISHTGIYKFRFKNSAMSPRICNLKVERIPENEDSKDFKTNVYWRIHKDTTFYTIQEKYLVKKEYQVKTIQPMTEYYINSGSHATFKGGKSRITFPVQLPHNTVEWYYEFSASRDKAAIENAEKSFTLVTQLTKLIDKTGMLGFGVNALTKPPGADYCDIYLLDYQNSSLFTSKYQYSYFTIGTRQNIKSGIVKMNGNSSPYYIGIKNPNSLYGVHVAVEVVAIVLYEEWGLRDVEKFKVNSYKVPYLKE